MTCTLRVLLTRGYAVKAPLFAAVALTTALTLSACGGTTTTTTSTPGVTSAAASTGANTPAPTAKAPADQTIDGTTLVTKMTDAMMKAGSGTMTMEMAGGATASAQQMSTKAQFAVSGQTMNVHATMGVMGQQMEIISLDGVMYLKSQMFASSGKPWIKIDPNGTDAFSKQMAPTLKQSADLRASLEVYKGSTATLVDSSGGLRHYRLSNVMVTIAPTAAPVTQNVDLWLDDQDRPAKMTTTTSGVTMQVTYSDWGAPVTIAAPPADQIGTLKMPGS